MPIRHSKLSNSVRKGIKLSFMSRQEHRRVFLAAQKSFLSRLKLSREQLAAAEKLERNSLRIQEATTAIKYGHMIRTAQALSIIKNTRRQIPGFIERNQLNFPPGQLKSLTELFRNLKRDLQRIPKEAYSLPTILGEQFLKDAKTINEDTLRNTIGAESFSKYLRNKERFVRIMHGRGVRLAEEKRAAPNN